MRGEIFSATNETPTSPNSSQAVGVIPWHFTSMDPISVRKHFDALAERYDHYKAHSWYYYHALKGIVREHVSQGKRVLEIGCGTGDLLFTAQPLQGTGIDISERMIEIARKKYRKQKNLSFEAADIETYRTTEAYDCILFFDVIEHLEKQAMSVRHLAEIAKPGSVLIASMANPLWEPLLWLLERVGLKMPEGPHHRLPLKELKKLLTEVGFAIVKEGRKLLVPTHIPFLSNPLNRLAERLPLLKELCLIQYLVCRRT